MTQKYSMPALVVPVFFALLFLAACGDAEHAPDEEVAELSYAAGDTLDFNGILIETYCYSNDKSNVGMDHPSPIPTSQTGPACARYCALKGLPVGMLSLDDEPVSWMLLSNPQILSDYMGRTVRIRGVVRSQGVMTPLRVEAKKFDGTWTFVI